MNEKTERLLMELKCYGLKTLAQILEEQAKNKGKRVMIWKS